MGGGLLQLVTYGIQDLYLTGNPQITFYKVVYRRHTNFAMESVRQIMYGSNLPGGVINCSIPRSGDLLHKIYLYLEVTEPDNANINYNNVLTMIDTVELLLSGNVIVRLTGEWISMWMWMYHDKDKFNILTQLALTPSGTKGNLFIPIPFWFCRDIGLAFPIIAMQYQKLEVRITYESSRNTDYELKKECTSAYMWFNYIYLDETERRLFSQTKHTYLIEQLQYAREQLDTKVDYILDLPFNYPIKELFWIVKDPNPVYYDSNLNQISAGPLRQLYWNNGVQSRDQIESAIIYINHEERIQRRSGEYFRVVQFYEHHSGGTQSQSHCIYMYSFALEPEKLEPTGTCNFSKIDSPQLGFTLQTYTTQPVIHNTGTRHIVLYAVNYNILIIKDGYAAVSVEN